MFIKFSDKTKKIIVKKSKDLSKDAVDDPLCTIYLDEEDEENIRIKILNKENYIKRKK
jgi:hypothetical protein